ncbi:hypothetical protein BsWGS_10119 [Bradybaena similaris]
MTINSYSLQEPNAYHYTASSSRPVTLAVCHRGAMMAASVIRQNHPLCFWIVFNSLMSRSSSVQECLCLPILYLPPTVPGANSFTHPVIPIIGQWDVMMEASAFRA